MFSAYPGITIFTTEWAEMSTVAWGVRGEEIRVQYYTVNLMAAVNSVKCAVSHHTTKAGYLPPFNVDDQRFGHHFRQY